MRKFMIAAAACASLMLAAAPANAALLCTVKAVSAESHGHKTGEGAVARAWVNWQGKMRNAYGRGFAVSKARSLPGYPKRSRKKRFDHSAWVRARGCYTKGVSCVTGSGITPVCECETNAKRASQRGCSVYRYR